MAEEIKFLDKTGLTQVISHLQQDTEEKIATAIENAIFAGGSDENVDNLPYLDAEKLNGYTSDDFVKVADLGTTTVGLATADAEGNVISETYAKNSDVNSNFTNLQSQIDTKVDKTTTVNGKALSSSIAITAEDVGADAQGAAADALTEAKTYADTASATALSDAKEYNDAAYANANLYTDTAIANLINGAPTTLDTLKEIADAMAENDEVVAALDTAIGTKANQNELDGHTGNTTIHITANERTTWNNKADAADLANYLPRDGGNVDGNITMLSNSAVDRDFIIKNSKREILSRVSDGGGYILHDITNGKRIIESLVDGTNTFNGIATENLQKDWDIATNFRIGWNEWCGAPGMRFDEKDGTIQCYLSAGSNQLYRKTLSGGTYTMLDSGNVGDYAITKEHMYNHIGGNTYIAYPQGGQFVHQNQTYTGLLKIKLPVSWTSTMMKFKVSVYNYADDTSVDYIVSGYNYSGEFWTSTSAYCSSKWGTKLSNLPVSFGHDGTYCAITIGTTTTVWDYPQIFISDISLGFSGYDYNRWNTGWEISFITSQLSRNSITIENTNIGYNVNNAATATVATTLARSGSNGAPMTFNWSGQSGQPTWLWGGEDGNNMYVYNPSNFSVNYANSAGTANNVWTQSHNGSWYINSNWDGTYFQVNAKSTDGSELPVGVNYAAYANASGTISNQGSAATKDIVTTITDPGAGAASSYKEGSIICVYE